MSRLSDSTQRLTSALMLAAAAGCEPEAKRALAQRFLLNTTAEATLDPVAAAVENTLAMFDVVDGGADAPRPSTPKTSSTWSHPVTYVNGTGYVLFESDIPVEPGVITVEPESPDPIAATTRTVAGLAAEELQSVRGVVAYLQDSANEDALARIVAFTGANSDFADALDPGFATRIGLGAFVQRPAGEKLM